MSRFKEPWKEVARNLPVGGSQKVVHCGPGQDAKIWRKAGGISLYCHRCGENLFERIRGVTARDFRQYREALQAAVQAEGGCKVPEAADWTEAPAAALVWLLRAGVRPELARKNGIGWNKDLNRVILPILRNGESTGFWTARAVHGERPKYMQGKGSRGQIWYDTRPGGPLVFTEDILSAIRVRQAGYSSAAILGTTAGELGVWPDMPSAVVWLDGDKAGRKGTVELRRRLGLLSIPHKVVRTELDPKGYTSQQIQEMIDA